MEQRYRQTESNILLVVGIARSLQFGKEFLLLGGNARLALFQSEPLGVPALLLDLGWILAGLLPLRVGTDGFMGLFVHGLDLVKE